MLCCTIELLYLQWKYVEEHQTRKGCSRWKVRKWYWLIVRSTNCICLTTSTRAILPPGHGHYSGNCSLDVSFRDKSVSFLQRDECLHLEELIDSELENLNASFNIVF